jgi:hypothetical protein
MAFAGRCLVIGCLSKVVLAERHELIKTKKQTASCSLSKARPLPTQS